VDGLIYFYLIIAPIELPIPSKIPPLSVTSIRIYVNISERGFVNTEVVLSRGLGFSRGRILGFSDSRVGISAPKAVAAGYAANLSLSVIFWLDS
jgi:hypothetical protein